MTVTSETPIGILMVHGYRGQPADLMPLESVLIADHGADAVVSLCLPGHGTGLSPTFDEAAFLAALAAAIDAHLAQGRRLVLLGHSTGGNLLLMEIARRQLADPSSLEALLLLVLCATPPRIDVGYAQRWADHTKGQQIALDDVGALVSVVNRLARRGTLPIPAPVLVVHGEADELVPLADADQWRRARLIAPLRQVRVAGAKHHLFTGQGAEVAIDTVRRVIADASHRCVSNAPPVSPTLSNLIPNLTPFVLAWPDTAWHVSHSPAARQAVGEDFEFSDFAAIEPTVANIEITTRCNLGCAACARTQLKLHSHFMNRDDFCNILAHMPHTFRIVLVGLGEPLMHPEVVDFIQLAVASGRQVSLVTNGMFMDANLAQALCHSGLSSITFSLDAVDQTIAQRVRRGSDMQQISANIRLIMETRRTLSTSLGTSVFTALRSDTIDQFEAIVDFVADHGIDALMVTDLNFDSNQVHSVNHAFTQEHARSFRKAIKRAVARGLPVLSVWGLEEFALNVRYMDYLLFRGEQLAHRATRRSHKTYCHSFTAT